jgi:predicted alpha/beta hydrolase
VDAFVMIASQTPYWKNFTTTMKPKLWFFWNLLLPGLTKLFGFFPASKIGLFEDLPKHVALQWQRWANSSNYIFDEYPEVKETFHSLTQPALVLTFEDDTIAPRKAAHDLLQYLPNMKIDHRHHSPEDIAVRAIGHFGFFKKRYKSTLWRESLDWLKKNAKKRHRFAA